MTSPSGTGWPRRRLQWLLGALLILGIGAVIGAVLGNVWIGLLLGLVVALGWLIAYESWRGRHVGLDDPDDDGAQV